MKIEYLIEDILRLLSFVIIVAFLLFDPLGIIPAQVIAQQADASATQDNDTYQSIINLLVMIFILSVLIEVALAVLFQWRVFLRFAHGRGWKVPIAFVVSLAIVIAHEIDLPGDVVAAFGVTTGAGKGVGYVIGAFIIAGGSSSVNAVFAKLGWRNPLAQNEKAKQERQRTKPATDSS